MPTFNLVDQAWIPCDLLSDGRRRELGLRDVLAGARDIREISVPSPLVVVALHRLLLAILHRNFGPENLELWRDIWERGTFEVDRVDAYLERWRRRFELFDSERPFYQVPRMDGAREHPVASLRMKWPPGITRRCLITITVAPQNLCRHPQVRGTYSLPKLMRWALE